MEISPSISTSYPGNAAFVSTAQETNHLRKEYEACRMLYQAQPPEIASFLENQAHMLMDAILQRRSRVRIQLPEMVGVALATGAKPTLRKVPAGARMHRIGGLVDRLARANLRSLVSQRIAELEGSPNLALATAASLLRYCSIVYLVKEILPAGRPVRYEAAEGEEIPSNPVDWNKGRTMEYAQCFYLPQWVALDPYGNLLVRSLSDAESSIAAMQRSFSIVSLAAAFAPYIVVDQEYQMKRYGLLGQLVNQGRALARHHMKNIIQTIQQRASTHSLNRGLSLSVPYFDDQALEMKTYEMAVIPGGRIEFTPAFVVRAARQVQVRIAQNFGLSPSTRKHLIINLRVLENAFTRTR